MTRQNLAERPDALMAPWTTQRMPAAVLPLHEHLLFKVCTLSSRLRVVAVRDVLSDHDIDMRDWLVLAALVELETGTQREIAKHTRLDKVAVSRATSRLKELGMIATSPNLQDGRSHLLELTPAGRDTFALCTQALAEMERKALGNLDQDGIERLNALLCEVEIAIDELEVMGVGL